jgi:hypothetical protein
MKFWKHTLPFLLLNILISAVTVCAVLYFFGPRIIDLAEERLGLVALPAPKATETNGEVPAQSTPLELNLLIGGVFGAGNLQTEYVLIKNQGKATAALLNWTLQGKRGQNYSFPDLRLAQNGTVKLFSKTGTDTVLELYMKSDVSLWQQGDILTLKDANGKVQTNFQVP